MTPLEKDALITYSVVAFTWLVISASIRFSLHLGIEVMVAIWVAGVSWIVSRLKRQRESKRYELAAWMRANQARVFCWFLISAVFLGVSLGDLPVFPSKMRSIVTSNITESKLWDFSIGVASTMAMILLMDIWRGRGAPVPRLTKIGIVVAAALLVSHKWADEWAAHKCDLEIAKEYPPPGLEGEIAQMCRVIQDAMERDVATGLSTVSNSTAQRLVHPGQHGCVRGTFQVERRVTHRFRVGIFANEYAAFPAWLRFSSGAHQPRPDTEADVRAVAVKLMGVPGKKALELEAGDDFADERATQDFLFLSSDVFAVNDPTSYAEFIRAIAAPESSYFWQMLKYILPSLNPLTWRWKFLWVVLKWNHDGLQVRNPLTATYFSTVSYALGKSAVKYSLRPCSINKARSKLDDAHYRKSSVFLREAMRRHLDPTAPPATDEESDDVCFEFLVQEQTDACAQPIEDPSVSWQGPWIRLATLTIPKQTFLHRDQQRFCADLSFSPWHTLPEHRPLGAIGQARKASYMAAQRTRRRLNQFKLIEPTGNETFAEPESVDPKAGAGDTKLFEYTKYAPPFEDMPPMIKTFPSSKYNFEPEKLNRLASTLLNVNANLLASSQGSSRRAFANFTSPDDWIDFLGVKSWVLSSALPIPTIAYTWKEDSEFARQFLAGVNPNVISVCSEIPRIMKSSLTPEVRSRIEGEVLRPIGQPGINELLEQGRLFIIDHEILEDIDAVGDHVFYAPIALFYLQHNLATGHRRLMPLLIQLTRTRPPAVNRLFWPPPVELGSDGQPKDYTEFQAGRVWLFARMHFMTADGQVHQLISHLAKTHLAIEPFLIAFFRQFHPSHPIFELMEPHFHETLAINDLGRNTLLRATGSDFDRVMGVGRTGGLQLAERYYRLHWTYDTWSLPNSLKAAGFFEVADPGPNNPRDNLPGYLYRDFSFMIWHAVRDFVEQYIHVHYASDAQVAGDVQLQAMRRELTDPEMGNLPGRVPTVNTRAELVDLIATVLYAASAQHSAVNFGQFDYYSFVPNRPLHLKRPMPENLDHVTLPYIIAALPDMECSMEIIILGRTLSLLEEEGLRGLYERRAKEAADKQRPHAAVFRTLAERLAQLEVKMVARQQAINITWPYLNPSQLAPSISI